MVSLPGIVCGPAWAASAVDAAFWGVATEVGPEVSGTSPTFQASSSKGTATYFSPIPRKPPTPITTVSIRPSAASSTSSMVPTRT